MWDTPYPCDGLVQSAEHIVQFICRDEAIAIGIKHVEHLLELLLGVAVHALRHHVQELVNVYCAAVWKPIQNSTIRDYNWFIQWYRTRKYAPTFPSQITLLLSYLYNGHSHTGRTVPSYRDGALEQNKRHAFRNHVNIVRHYDGCPLDWVITALDNVTSLAPGHYLNQSWCDDNCILGASFTNMVYLWSQYG